MPARLHRVGSGRATARSRDQSRSDGLVEAGEWALAVNQHHRIPTSPPTSSRLDHHSSQTQERRRPRGKPACGLCRTLPWSRLALMPVALWSVTGSTPKRLGPPRVFDEKHLEDWVLADPQMVAEGLVWVARQPCLPDRTKPDLLGLTREGGLVVAELKRGQVNIGTLVQAMHYVLTLSTMSFDAVRPLLTMLDAAPDGAEQAREALAASFESGGSPEFSIMLIGTGRAPELDRASAFLTDRGLNLPITIVSFTPFADLANPPNVFLTRDVEDSAPPSPAPRAGTDERFRQLASDLGCLDHIELFTKTAMGLGLGVKTWVHVLTMVPPTGINRTLLYLRPESQGIVDFNWSEENLVQWYNANLSTWRPKMGPVWSKLSLEQLRARLVAFSELMQEARDQDQPRQEAGPSATPELSPGVDTGGEVSRVAPDLA